MKYTFGLYEQSNGTMSPKHIQDITVEGSTAAVNESLKVARELGRTVIGYDDGDGSVRAFHANGTWDIVFGGY